MNRALGFLVALTLGLGVGASAFAAPITYSVLEPSPQIFEIDSVDVGISAAELAVDFDNSMLTDFRVVATDDTFGLVLTGPLGLTDFGSGIFQVASGPVDLFAGSGPISSTLQGFVIDVNDPTRVTLQFSGQTSGSTPDVSALQFRVSQGELSGITPTSPIPEPASGLLFMAGLVLVGHAVRENA
jgi:hypothetical protein